MEENKRGKWNKSGHINKANDVGINMPRNFTLPFLGGEV